MTRIIVTLLLLCSCSLSYADTYKYPTGGNIYKNLIIRGSGFFCKEVYTALMNIDLKTKWKFTKQMYSVGIRSINESFGTPPAEWGVTYKCNAWVIPPRIYINPVNSEVYCDDRYAIDSLIRRIVHESYHEILGLDSPTGERTVEKYTKDFLNKNCPYAYQLYTNDEIEEMLLWDRYKFISETNIFGYVDVYSPPY